MKITHKILYLVTLVVVFLFCNNYEVCLAKDVKGTEYEFEVYTLKELGIIDYRPDGTYRPDEMVTKAEMVKSLVIASGLEQAAEASKGTTPFSDVAADHWASGYINVAAEYRFISGYPNGTFAPDDTITYTEAITYCLNVLGYRNAIEMNGTWPANYIAKAIELDLMKNVEFNLYSDGVNRGNCALLLFNMLQTPMWNISSGFDDSSVYGQDNYMLTTKFRKYEYVNGVYNGYIIDASDTADEAEVKIFIDDKSFKYE